MKDKITAEGISAILDTKIIGKNIVCLEEIDSTNNEAKRNSDMPDGTVFIAELQTGGKGRLGRNWSSPKGVGAWFTILLKPDVSPENVSAITLVAGLAVCKAIGGKIKYPNDIVIGTKKVCGILTELCAQINTVNHVVCGIGINVNNDSFDDEIKNRATSIFIETGKKLSRSSIIAQGLTEFEPLYQSFLNNGLSEILEEYKSYCVTLNSYVTVTYQGNSIQGICRDILPDGSIVIDTGNERLIINSGEVSVRGVYGYV